MHLEGHRTISNSASSKRTEATAPESQTSNTNKSDLTTKARLNRSSLSQVDVTRRERSASRTTEYASQTMKDLSLTTGKKKPRGFITGIEYKTKFMRETSCDPGQKFRYSSGIINPQQTKADTITVSRWRLDGENACLVKQPKGNEEAKKSTSQVGPNHPQNSANRTPPQINKSTAEVRMRHARGHSGAQAKSSGKTKTPCTANKVTNHAKETQGTVRAAEKPTSHKPSRTATPFSDATKTETSSINNEEITPRLEMNETPRFSLNLEQINDSTEPHISDKFLHRINKADLSINLPNSPTSESRGSNSLHTTPRSPRIVHKIRSNSFLNPAISETLSPKARNSVLYSEMLEMQRTSSPRATVGCSPKSHIPSNTYKILPSSDVTLTTKTWESVANESRTKTSTSKQEPMIFTTQFVPLLSWTVKTNPGVLFKPHIHEGSSSRPNSSAYQDGGNASNDKSHENVLSNLPPKNTTNSNVNAIQNECFLKQQQMAANEDYVLLDPSLTDIPGEGEKITKATISKKKSLSNYPNRSHTSDQQPVVRKVWKPTRPQQAVSGCALRPDTTSQLPKRPQSMKTIMMSKQPPALGDFAKRPVSAGIKGKIKETTMDKKPVWK